MVFPSIRVPVIVPAVTLPKFALIEDKLVTFNLSAEMVFAAIWFEVMAFAAILLALTAPAVIFSVVTELAANFSAITVPVLIEPPWITVTPVGRQGLGARVYCVHSSSIGRRNTVNVLSTLAFLC